jgi:L-lactate dehydrogenase complex protein LldE
MNQDAAAPRKPKVALFVTCLVDLFRPSIGFAAVRLLELAGCTVEVPKAQTCCGQPAYTSGDRRTAAALASQVIKVFAPYDYVVAPSGSCAGMLHRHYPGLFEEDTTERAAAQAFAAKCHELVSFLVRVMKLESTLGYCDRPVTYHDSCSGLRELGIRDEPRRLLQQIPGLELKELFEADVCCGFGGTFCIKYPAISNAMVEQKVSNVEKSGARILLAGDLGCLMNMAGKLARQGSKIEVRHIAEVLSGDLSQPAIAGESRS